MLASALFASTTSSTIMKPLPDGLKDEINQYLFEKKVNGNCAKLLSTIEKILQKFLTRNDGVRKQWFKDKVMSYGSDCIDDHFFTLLERYGFSCIDVYKSHNDESSDEDESDAVEDVTLNKEPLSDEKNIVLATLNAYDVPRAE
jgi:hypothetical protein